MCSVPGPKQRPSFFAHPSARAFAGARIRDSLSARGGFPGGRNVMSVNFCGYTMSERPFFFNVVLPSPPCLGTLRRLPQMTITPL